MPSFRLDTQRWIPVVWSTGEYEELSLLGAVQRAEEIRALVGNPLEVAVLTRLLLAIAHSVSSPADAYEWIDVWNDRGTLLTKMVDHIRENEASFDLYSSERPFLQNPKLPEPTTSPAVLVYERAQGNNPVFLDASQVAYPAPIPSSEAARALLVTHSFAGSGTGSNNPLNGGKKDVMYAGPLCARMIAILEGDNLAKTIALNLASGMKTGKPNWLRNRVDVPIRTSSEGVADLYTRPTRSARLRPADDLSCNAVSLYMGEAVDGGEEGGDDPMIPRYLAADKKFKVLRLSRDRASWRSAHVLLTAIERSFARPICALAQLRPLASEGSFPCQEPVQLRVLGVDADAKGPVTHIWRDETLPFGLSVIADDKRYAALEAAVGAAERASRDLIWQLKSFGRRYLQTSTDQAPNDEDVDRLVGDLVGHRVIKVGNKTKVIPLLTDFWSAVGSKGERIALDGFDNELWTRALRDAKSEAYRNAIDRLPPDACRFRAEFARTEDGKQDQPKRGKQTL